MDYFKQLLDLLKTEREVDRQSYRQQAETLSVQQRRAGGVAWYPVVIKGSEMSKGDYLTIEVERTTLQDTDHQFRNGTPAALFSQHDAKNDRIEGTISWLSGNTMKIALRADDLPDWSRDGKLGVDLLFDDNSYDDMQNALRLAGALREKTEEGRLIRILIGEQPASPPANTASSPAHSASDTPATVHSGNTSSTTHPGNIQSPRAASSITPRLNDSQRSAVQNILSADQLAIVHGPPGTGKTTTLVQAIKALWEQDRQQILVVAPSNTAVDLLSEKLSEQGMNVLRIGNPARVSERLQSLTLDSKMTAHGGMKEIKKLKKQASEFRDMAQKYRRSFGKAEREQRRLLFDEARKILKEVDKTEQFIIDDLVAKAQVITATLVGANHYTIRNRKFRTAVIDEAGQALEPASWIPILKTQKLVLAGDHCQLPPTIKSNEAARKGLSNTLLEKCVALHPANVVLLEEQYRMNEAIMGYSSSVFYQDRLRAHATVAQHRLFPEDSPLAFVDTAGCGFEERTDGVSTSNPEEAALLFRHLTQLVTELSARNATNDFPSIAIISPYRQQIEVLKDQLAHAPLLQPYKQKISVNTIDSFQGQERDIVYISMTRSNTENKIGFLSDIRRMNVAMTRARKKLVVVGDSATLSQSSFYAGFISYAESRNAYLSAWEFADI